MNNYYEMDINGKHNSLVRIVPIKDYIWNEKKPLNYIADHRHTISQDLPNYFQVTKGNYMVSKKTMLDSRYILGKKYF